MGAAKSTGAGTKKRAKAASKALVGEQRSTLRLAPIRAFAEVLFDEDLHAKRVESLANGDFDARRVDAMPRRLTRARSDGQKSRCKRYET